MVSIAVVSIFLAAAAAGSGTNLVLLFSGLGGLSGLAALITVWINYRRGQQQAKVDDKSVAITELEKAVPGLGDIIEQWQAVVHQLQTDLSTTRLDLADCRSELEACRKRLEEIEGP